MRWVVVVVARTKVPACVRVIVEAAIVWFAADTVRSARVGVPAGGTGAACTIPAPPVCVATLSTSTTGASTGTLALLSWTVVEVPAADFAEIGGNLVSMRRRGFRATNMPYGSWNPSVPVNQPRI